MENTKLTERFPVSENGWLIQDFNGIHRLVKLTVNKDFLAVNQSRQEYEASIKATATLMRQIAKQAVEPPNDEDVAGAQRCARQEKADSARHDLKSVTTSLPLKTQRAVEFIKEKGAFSWLSVIPLKEMNFTLNKREFRDGN